MTGNIPYISREQTATLLTCFTEAIEKPESQPLLFNVWGIGGVGKSTLLDKLVEQHPDISFTRVYFGSTPDIGTSLKLMAKLYDNLPVINEWGKEYERFPELYQQYEQTLANLKLPDRKESEAQAASRKDAIKKLVGGGAKTLSQVTPIKNIPGAEDKIGMIAEGGVDLVDWLQKQRVTKKDQELQSLMLKPIPQLTKAFVAGIIAKSQQQPVVLLLDTYEKTNIEIDDWLWQYLIANSDLKSHRVRIVVAGRKNLLKQESWRKLQQDLNSVYSLEIERFTQEQTVNYFADIDIANIEQIYQVTKGLPYYLNWMRKQIREGKKLDFSQGNQEIVSLLLQGLNKEQKRVIQLAACCRWFDKSLIKCLVGNQELDFDKVVDPELNCFEWLVKLDFVEFSQNTHRLDDVARDVFRLSLCQADKDQFRLVNNLLAKYYEDKAIAEVLPDSSPPRTYETQEWKEYTAESLYHELFARQQDYDKKFLSHLFSGCYLQETDVVMIPFNAISAESNIENNDLLSSSVKKLLQTIEPIFAVNCLAFEEQALVSFVNRFSENYFGEELSSEDKVNDIIREIELQEQFEQLFAENKIDDLEKRMIIKQQYMLSFFQESFLQQVQTLIKPAIEYCFNQIDSLSGLSKFVGLIYKAKYCPATQQLRYLKEAKSQAEQIIVKSDPEFSSGLFLWDLGNALVNLGRYEEAIASYDKALEIKPDQDEGWYNRGIALVILGRSEEAIASYDKALEIKPDKDEAWYNRGNALDNLGRSEEAIASWDKALEIKPDQDEGWYNRGIALVILGRSEEAIASYDKALEIKPDDDQAWNNRGVALDNLGRYEEAIASWDKALEIKPDKDEAWYNRGNALVILGRSEEAIASYDKALEIKPDDDQAWNNRGNALVILGRYEEAIASWDKALEIKPDKDEAWYNRGIALDNLGRYEEAIASWDKALEIKPDKDEAWNNRGIALVNLGRSEEAIASYDKALEIKPDKDEAWYNRGNALGNLGRSEEAIASYDQALEIKPDKDQAWYNRACCFALQNQIDLAIESLTKAISLNQEYQAMAKTDVDFDSVRDNQRFQSLLNSSME